ncbi:S66 family peptidase [Pseudalkalibacillus caeni]|uniref:LD-carboxypeptidase n=1 Tax=Exobacillus caeni TaxID=2574798 RepID=A0A5R9F5J7_9BACL|nr:S66 peptidase family protein [Pseudalkalibacillus caeni]TLS38311.1 LD-carboxypeptidase [Pseudalkalibacillus caeni]
MTNRIRYPKPLQKGDAIAVTAPSSGVEANLHSILKKAKQNVEDQGYRIVEGETIWTEVKAASSTKEKRAEELMGFLLDDRIKAILPPWGGEFLMEILPLMDWEELKKAPPKWVLGYSDISTFLFSYTLLTGTATAHGTNFFDLSSPGWDELSKRWIDVLSLEKGQTIVQHSSSNYQSSWEKAFNNQGTGFDLDTPTEWKVAGDKKEAEFSGRLIGGCQDTLSILLGTPFAPVKKYIKDFAEEGGIWYLESCDMAASGIYRSLWQMKQAGWFENTKGVLIGRPANYKPAKDFELEDALERIFADMNIPVVYDMDIGHMPPQNILVNGAVGTVKVSDGKGTLEMVFD